MKIVLGHIQSPPPRPRSINPRVPAELEAVILKCLEKDPKKRYQKVARAARGAHLDLVPRERSGLVLRPAKPAAVLLSIRCGPLA